MANLKDIHGSKGGCFPAGTLIKTPGGYKSIEEFKQGDSIIAFNNLGGLESAKVIEVHKHLTKDLRGDKLIRITHGTLLPKGTFTATANHWVFTSDRQFKELGDFEVGELLTLSNGVYSKILSIEILPDQEYVYNLTVNPCNTFIANDVLVHNKGGGKGTTAYTPIEDPNSLQSNAVVRIIDLLCEGEIEGLVNEDKSIFFDETQLQQDGGDYNFSGIEIEERYGAAAQTFIDGFTDVIPSTTVKNVQVTYAGGGVTHAITDTDVDDIKIVISVPKLMSINDQGDVKETEVSLAVDIQPDGESWQTDIKTIIIQGKCTSTYQREQRINNLSSYGDGPWTIKVRRNTADSGTAKLINDTYWYSIVEIKNRKIAYRERALIGIKADVKSFGNRVPRRAYDIKGLKIEVPNNRIYNAGTDTATYSGTWNGTFKTEWSDNPAWVLYDILNKGRYGLDLDTSYIDKWALYTIGVYCDTSIDDGFGSTERRFTFNGVIHSRAEAIHYINAIASTFRSMPFWSGGTATFVQDSPKDATRLITAANVENGLFNYTGTGLKDRHTTAYVTWNNPDDFFKQAVEVVEDADGIDRYGYNPIDVAAFACSSRGQAARFGKWILESELNEIETVNYIAGIDHMDCLPGEIIKIADPHNSANNRFGGRTVSGTINSLAIDEPIDLETGESYSVSIITTSGTIIDRSLSNSIPSSDVEILTWAQPIDETEIPQTDSVWVVTATNLTPKTYRILETIETEPHRFEVNAVYHDPNKYARVESGIYLETPVYVNIPADELSPPTNITLEEYTYIDGGNNQQFGAMVSWTPSTDPRTIYYEIQMQRPNEAYHYLGSTSENSYDIRPITTSGTYDVRTRGVSLTAKSAWLTYNNFPVLATLSGILPPTGLQLKDGGTTWSGSNCEIEWTAGAGAYNANYEIDNTNIIKQYKIETLRSDDTLLRTDYVDGKILTYTYLYMWNVEDNLKIDNGGPYRQLKFKVYTIDIYDNESDADTDVFSNPAPSMAGLTPTITSIFKGVKIEWGNIVPTDPDGHKFEVYCDTSSPPTTLVGEFGWDTTTWIENGLDTDVLYYARIKPYDLFGAGTISNTSIGVEPLKVTEIDIDMELTQSILITDTESTASGTLAELYDRVLGSGGPTYTTTASGIHINYDFGIENFIDRISIWADKTADVYIGYKGLDQSWSYLKAEADHTLTAEDELLAASNEADAQTNYWTTVSGKNVAIFPERVIANECRLYIYNASATQIHELVFMREVIAEQITANSITAHQIASDTITATQIYGAGFGTLEITSGKIQINTTDALEIKAGGDIKVLAGGDIILESDSANSGVITFEGTLYKTHIDSMGDTGYLFGIHPDEAGHDIVDLYLGVSPIKEFRSIALYATNIMTFVTSSGTINLQTGGGGINLDTIDGDTISLTATYDADYHATVNTYANYQRAVHQIYLEANGITKNLKINYQPGVYPYFTPLEDNEWIFGSYLQAWQVGYAYDWNTVTDFYNFDDKDDLAAIHAIKGSGKIEDYTGNELIDDDTIPEFLLSKQKRDEPEQWEEEILTSPACKQGDIIRNSKGKPYLSTRSTTSLIFGAIRQLDNKVEKMKKEIG